MLKKILKTKILKNQKDKRNRNKKVQLLFSVAKAHTHIHSWKHLMVLGYSHQWHI